MAYVRPTDISVASSAPGHIYHHVSPINAMQAKYQSGLLAHQDDDLDAGSGDDRAYPARNSTSPLRDDRTGEKAATLAKTLSDIDRRTRRSDGYVLKKIEGSERRREQTRYRAAREIPLDGASAGASATAHMYASLRNGGVNHHVAGLRIRMIQEEIAKRHAQSEEALFQQGVPTRQARRRPESPVGVDASEARTSARGGGGAAVSYLKEQHRQSPLPPSPSSPPPHPYFINYDGDRDYVDKSNSVRRRLDEARRSTETSVRTLFDAAATGLERREFEERSAVSADQTQQFARLTAFKAMQYAAASTPSKRPGDASASASELEKFLVMSGFRERERLQDQEEMNYSPVRNAAPSERAGAAAAVSTPSTVPRQQRRDATDSDASTSFVAVPAKPEAGSTKSGAPARPGAATKAAAPSSGAEQQQQQQAEESARLMRNMFAQENLARRESEQRQDLATDAFDAFMAAALLSPTRASPTNKGTATTQQKQQKQQKQQRSSEDVDVLASMFVQENLMRREAQARHQAHEDALEARIAIMNAFSVGLSATTGSSVDYVSRPRGAPSTKSGNPASNSTAAASSGSSPRDQQRSAVFQRDSEVLRGMFLVESFEKKEAQARQAIIMDAFSSAPTPASSAPRGSANMAAPPSRAAAANKQQAPTNAASYLYDDNSAVLRNLFVIEQMMRRESETRSEIAQDALAVTALDAVKLHSQPAASQQAVPARAKQDQDTLRLMFVTQSLLRREQEARAVIADESFTQRMDTASSFAVALQRRAAAAAAGASPARGGGAAAAATKERAAADRNMAVLREMFILENSMHKEADIRAGIAGAESEARVQIAAELLQAAQRIGGSGTAASKARSAPAASNDAALEHERKQSVFLRNSFTQENMARREAEVRAGLDQEQLAERLDLASKFNAFFLRSKSGFDAVRAGKDRDALSSMFLTESLLRREQEARAVIVDQSFAHRMDIAAAQLARRSSGGSMVRSAASAAAPNDAALQHERTQSVFLRNSFTQENMARREAEVRAELDQQQLLARLDISSKFNACFLRPKAGFDAVRAGKDRDALSSMFLTESLLRREQEARVAVLDEEAQLRTLHTLSLHRKPLGAALRDGARVKKDMAALRETYLGEYALRRESEFRMRLQEEAGQARAEMLAQQWRSGLVMRLRGNVGSAADDEGEL